jgi:uncharacterized protein YbaR (Trm112 family)
MKYRKKPIVVEAVQRIDFDGGSIEQCFSEFPKWLEDAIEEKIVDFLRLVSPERHSHRFAIKTLEGTMDLNRSDWLICGVKGELYPCKDEIFKMTYNKAEDENNQH